MSVDDASGAAARHFPRRRQDSMAQPPKRRARALLTVAEVSERLHVPVAVVMAAVDADVLPHLREESGQLRFYADEIDGIEIRAEK
jgi:hypothetical protein